MKRLIILNVCTVKNTSIRLVACEDVLGKSIVCIGVDGYLGIFLAGSISSYKE